MTFILRFRPWWQYHHSDGCWVTLTYQWREQPNVTVESTWRSPCRGSAIKQARRSFISMSRPGDLFSVQP